MSQEEVFALIIFITAMASHVNHCYLQLPKSIGLTFVTFFISMVIVGLDMIDFPVAVDIIEVVSEIEFSHNFLSYILGFLLFAGALQIDHRELLKHRTVIMLLSTVSVLISTLLIGSGVWVLILFAGMNLPWIYALLFGSLISPTDPVAVMSILKSLKAPKSLEMKIAGEALFNDAMGIVLFVAINGLAHQTRDFSMIDLSCYFLRQAFGGLVYGLIQGYIFSSMIRRSDSSFVIILMTLALVSSGFVVSEHYLGVSPVISTSVAGLYIGATMRRSTCPAYLRQHLYDFWEFVDEIFNAILFVIIGLEFLEITTSPSTFVACIGSIGICLIARWISVAVPLTCLVGFRFVNSQLIWLMTWGGMRGGISIALALMLSDSTPGRNLIVAVTYAVVIFSIIVQGMTIAPLMQKMNLSQTKIRPHKPDPANTPASVPPTSTSHLIPEMLIP